MPLDPVLRSRLRYMAAAFVPSLGVATFGVLVEAHRARWYEGLALPSFAPPGWLVISMTASVALATAYALYRVLCRPDWMPDRPHAIRAFEILTALNLALPLSVAARASTAALIVALVLLIATMLATRRFGRVDRMAGRLLALCGLWAGFATLVMLSVVIRT